MVGADLSNFIFIKHVYHEFKYIEDLYDSVFGLFPCFLITKPAFENRRSAGIRGTFATEPFLLFLCIVNIHSEEWFHLESSDLKEIYMMAPNPIRGVGNDFHTADM